LSVVKWTLLSTLVGGLVGLSTTVFLKSLTWSIRWVSDLPYALLLLPVGGFLTGLLLYTLAPEAEGHGTEAVIKAVHERRGAIAARVAPVKLLVTVFTIASGGSAGKEGPAAQIGASVASTLARFLRLTPQDRKILVICGISAGFASVFGTPIAGALFGIEVLFLGQMLYEVLLPSFVAGIIAFQTSRYFGITYFYHPITFVPRFSEGFFLKMIAAGILFGLTAILLVESLKYAGQRFKRIPVWPPLRPAIGASLLMLLALFVSRDSLGLGLRTIEASVSGGDVPFLAFLWKVIATSLTLGSGGSGGIITPIFYIGSTAGSFFAGFLRVDPGTLAAIGMVAVLAGAANTPIAASIMAIELFGPGIGVYAAVASVVSYLISGHRSVYMSQILASRKSQSLRVSLQKDLEHLEGVELSEAARRRLLRLQRVLRRIVWREQARQEDRES